MVLILLSGCRRASDAKPGARGNRTDVSLVPTAQAADEAAGDTQLTRLLEMQQQAGRAYQGFLQQKNSYWNEYISGVDSAWQEANPESSATSSWNDFVRRQNENWSDYAAAQQRAWQEYAARDRANWDEYVKSVEAKWDTFQGSTREEWVEYGGARDTKSYVDFREGYTVMEVVVEPAEKDWDKAAREKLRELTQTTLSQDDGLGTPIMQGQIADPTAFLNTANHPMRAGSVKGHDGVTRQRYVIAAKLVPDHLRKRAERYNGLVSRFSQQYDLDPALVLAIIETESAFNPRAVSWANAYGLMQIVPKFAGRETWREINKADGIPDGEYLLNPENNIRHGCCYLHLLHHRHWVQMATGAKKDYTIICSYNCGPLNVQRMVIRKFGPPERHDEREWFDLLTSHTPKETQDYLRKVTSARERWRTQ